MGSSMSPFSTTLTSKSSMINLDERKPNAKQATKEIKAIEKLWEDWTFKPSKIQSKSTIPTPARIPKITMNIRNYELEGGTTDSKSMTIPTISVDSGLYLDKKLKLVGKNFVQTLEPRIFYSYTPTNLKGNRCEREVKVR